jgi:DNA-binding NtrC family response regulator
MKKPILFVDDDPVALSLLIDTFKRVMGDQYTIQKASTAEEAEEILMEDLTRKGTLPVLIVSDWIMPGKRGDTFLNEVAKQYPEISLVLHSGLSDQSLETRLKGSCNLIASIAKPWDGHQHLELIRQSIN